MLDSCKHKEKPLALAPRPCVFSFCVVAMSVVSGFGSLSSFVGRRESSFGFGNCRRFDGIYFPIYRDPAIVSATEVISRPDIAVSVPLAGDTGAAKGQESQKNDATI
jgi:hypothetical protein